MKKNVVQQLFQIVIIIFSIATMPGLATPKEQSNTLVIPEDIQQLITQEIARRSSEGFMAGTLVKTPTGYAAIESLKKGSPVLAYNQQTKQRESVSITDILKTYLKQAIDIRFADGSCIRVAPQTLFFDYRKNDWILIECLDRIKQRLNNNAGLDIVDIKPITLERAEIFYLLLVEPCHNFFVTERDILVHNFVFSASLATWVFGSGLEICGIALGAFSYPIVAAVVTILVSRIGWAVALEWLNQFADPRERYDITNALSKYMDPASIARFVQATSVRSPNKVYIRNHIIDGYSGKCQNCKRYPKYDLEDMRESDQESARIQFQESLNVAQSIQHEIEAQDPDFTPIEYIGPDRSEYLEETISYPDPTIRYDEHKEYTFVDEHLNHDVAINETSTSTDIGEDPYGIVCGYPIEYYNKEDGLLIQPITEDFTFTLLGTPIQPLDNIVDQAPGCGSTEQRQPFILVHPITESDFQNFDATIIKTKQDFSSKMAVGRKGQEKHIAFAVDNEPTIINGRYYRRHAIDRMQHRGIPPSVVENTIKEGIASPDPIPTRTQYYNNENNITAIVEKATGEVVTLFYGKGSKN